MRIGRLLTSLPLPVLVQKLPLQLHFPIVLSVMQHLSVFFVILINGKLHTDIHVTLNLFAVIQLN